MSEFAIQVDQIGKRYRISGHQATYGTLRDSIASSARAALNTLRGTRARSISRDFWALRDVSFQIRRGEVTGLIGPNGAGKSTLLKIISGITSPSSGQATIYGRVGSLLEVGTGFHPELTGRENIYLNGAILGMRRSEVNRQFDAIVDFAGIEQFLDTPVKRYSSGMHMRLAFAVAAHLESDILVVDEVLAVGDAAFQKKCLGKMGTAASEGRTVLFVSHSMPAIQSLCERALLLDGGHLIEDGPPASVISHYLESQLRREMVPLNDRQDRIGSGSVRASFLQIESMDPDGIIRPTSRLKFIIGYCAEKPVRRPQFVVSIYDDRDIGLYLLHNEFVGGLPEVLPPAGSVTCLTDPINLTPGRCVVHLELLTGNVQADLIQYAAMFDVEADDVYGSGHLPQRDWVMALIDQKWWLNQQ